MKFGIKSKLLCCCGIVAAIVLAQGGINLQTLYRLGDSSKRAFDTGLKAAALVEKMKLHASQMQQLLNDASVMALTKNRTIEEESIRGAAEHRDGFKSAADELLLLDGVPSEVRLSVSELRDSIPSLHQAGVAMVRGYDVSAQRGYEAMKPFDEATYALLKTLGKTDAATSEQSNSQLDEILTVLRFGQHLNMSLSCLAVFLLLGVVWYLTQSIAARLNRLSRVTLECSEKRDVGVQIHDPDSDEIGELARSFNSLLSGLRGVIDSISQSTSMIGSSSSEIAAVSRQQQATASEIAATTTQIEATSKQIANTSEDLSKTMQDVRTVTAETSDLATDGQGSLDAMRTTMQGIMEACSGITEKLATLNQRASRIGNVVTTIAKVADQTNLLSLNAAIEAEKAGEFGSGFAVVAREIRRLADQTASSTIDIEAMVKEIQGAVSGGVMGMERFAHDVTKGVKEVEVTSAQLSNIIARIQTLAPSFETVAQGMQSQAVGARQITESLSQLSTAARQTAESLAQSNQSIEQLHQATVLLKEEGQRYSTVTHS